MAGEPLVSVLIPCYKADRFVREAVESALGQTHRNVEVVVVDDGSPDQSLDVLKEFGASIRLESGPNRGACAARNRAFELSQGEFIQYLDADDRLDPRKIELQLPLLLEDRADMVLSKIGLFGDAKGERPEKRPHPEPVGDPFLYFLKFGIGTPAPLHRRSFIERSGGFLHGLKRGQEADFHLRLAALNPRVTMLDQILVWVRMHDGERITNRPVDINEVVTTLCHMSEFMDRQALWTTERRELVADRLLKASRSCFAAGQRAIALQGLRQAIAVHPAVTRHDRWLRRTLTGLLGVERAEIWVHQMRTLTRRCRVKSVGQG